MDGTNPVKLNRNRAAQRIGSLQPIRIDLSE